jgi:hypothetical protein
MWSPAWEMDYRESWQSRTDTLMDLVVSWDPVQQRPHGAHDRALIASEATVSWEDWQTILPRQSNYDPEPGNELFSVNHRTEGRGNNDDLHPNCEENCEPDGSCPCDYPGVIIAAEDLWENRDGSNSMPSSAIAVQRMTWGLLLAGVLPMYDDTWGMGDMGGEGTGKAAVNIAYDWWYGGRVHYRDPQFVMQNHLVSSNRQAASGIAGRQYVVYNQDAGDVTIDLSATSTSDVFDVTWLDPDDGTESSGGTVAGGAHRTLTPPIEGDSVMFIGKRLSRR